MHSLMAVTVKSDHHQQCVYVLEKAEVQDSQLERTKNGVFISDWANVVGFVDREPLHVLEGETLISVRDLRDKAVALGDYNVSTSNCHHAAFAIFNYCAAILNEEEVKISELPNKNLSGLARIIGGMGINIASRASTVAPQGHSSSSRSFESSRNLDHSTSRISLVQNSFASEDAMPTMKFRDAVDSRVPGWRMCPLLQPGVDDDTWLTRWQHQLQESGAVIIVFSAVYRNKCAPGSALMKEASTIIIRAEIDSNFRIFVLDPGVPDEDSNRLRSCLVDLLPSLRFQEWCAFLVGAGLESAALKTAFPKFRSPDPQNAGMSSQYLASRMGSVTMVFQASYAAADFSIFRQYCDTVVDACSGWQPCKAIQHTLAGSVQFSNGSSSCKQPMLF